MTNRQPTPSGAALVAIDIAKNRHEVLIERPGQSHWRLLTILDTRTDHDRLIDILDSLGFSVIAGFEATDNYQRALVWRLIEAGIELRLISSVALARTRKALYNGWDKNDPKDPQVILNMLRIGLTQHYHDPLVEGLNNIQELSKTHAMVSKSKSGTLHRIQTHYLPLYFPEIDRLRNNSRSEWFFAFLDRFPAPGSNVALDKDAFIAAAWDVVGRKVSKARLLVDIYETARVSVGLPVSLESPAIAMFRIVISEARSLIRQRNEIEGMAHELLQAYTDYQRLRQIPGIGPINALTILAEAVDLRRFGRHRQFLKFCGLDLATHQSGQFRGQTRLSKYGNARLRRALWMAAQIAIRQRENSFRDKFERYIAKDWHNADLRRKALVAVTAKMARVVHVVIKSGTDYRPFFERAVPSGKNSLRLGREGVPHNTGAKL